MIKLTGFADSHVHAYAPLAEGRESLHSLSLLGVTDANLLAYTYIETGIDNNLVCLYYKEKCTGTRFRVFGGLYYEPELNNSTMPYLDQAQLLVEMGCDGLKFLDMKPNYNLYCGCSMDDKVYDPLYDWLEREKLPIVTHIADPANFWHRDQMAQGAIDMGWCYEDPKFLGQQQIFDITLRRLEKNPGLKMSLAHCGFMTRQPELFTHVLDAFPNVTFDLAPGWEIFVDFANDYSTWRDIFMRYSKRILYGTDACTFNTFEQHAELQRTMIETVSHDSSLFPIPHYPVAMMRGFELSEEAQRNICHDNYFRFVGEDVRPLNKSLILEHARLILSIAEARGDLKMMAVLDELMK